MEKNSMVGICKIKELAILMQSVVVLPHGFYVGTCGDGGYRYWIAKKDKKVVAFGFRYC